MFLIEFILMICIFILAWWCSYLTKTLQKVTRILEENSIFIPKDYKATFLKINGTALVNIDGINEDVFQIVVSKKLDNIKIKMPQ